MCIGSLKIGVVLQHGSILVIVHQAYATAPRMWDQMSEINYTTKLIGVEKYSYTFYSSVFGFMLGEKMKQVKNIVL